MPNVTTDQIELDDIQGLVLRSYLHLAAAAYVLLRIGDAAGARRWVDERASQVAPASAGRSDLAQTAVHLAFTHSGLKALELDASALRTFSREFQEGMATSHRRRILGDWGESAPETWRWGGEGTEGAVDVLLMLFARDATRLDQLLVEQRASWTACGLREVVVLDSVILPDQKEHFGFHDGIAQPVLTGTPKAATAPEGSRVAAGEFVLGYPNEYGKIPESPAVDPLPGAPALRAHTEPGKQDLGRNGTYLVFRQLHQDVSGFWRSMAERTRTNGSTDPRQAVWLASKMVGRWPNGAPLAIYQESEPALAPNADRDGFLYHEADPHGYGCPVGAHIRRTNPRDSLTPDPEDSLTVSRHHRLLRRGRSYGPPRVESMRVEDVMAVEDDRVDRGLHFICLNSDIARQFEFVQHTWVTSPKFEGAYTEPDPLVGNHAPIPEVTSRQADTYTVPQAPVRRRETELETFVRTRGGAYFFLPSLSALRFLARMR